MKKIFMILLLVLVISGCNNKNDAIKFKEEYEALNGVENNGKIIRTISIDKDNPFIYKEASDIVDMINDKETFIVYFGFSKCPWCRSMIEKLIEVAKDYKVDTIYYVDVLDIRDTLKLDDNNEVITDKNGSKDYMKLIKLLDNVLSDYNLVDSEGNKVSTNEKRIYAPNVVSIVKGKATLLTEGISDSQEDAYQDLTDEMLDEEYDMLSKVMEEIMGSTACSTNSKC